MFSGERSTDPRHYAFDDSAACRDQIEAKLKDSTSVKYEDSKAVHMETTKQGEHVYS